MTNIPVNFESTDQEKQSPPVSTTPPQEDSSKAPETVPSETVSGSEKISGSFPSVDPIATKPLSELSSTSAGETQDLSSATTPSEAGKTIPLSSVGTPKPPKPSEKEVVLAQPQPPEKEVVLVQPQPAATAPASGGGLSMEDTVQLLMDLANLQENLARAESQTQLARKHVEIVQEQLAKVNEEKSQWHDQLLRQRAEFENYRKRVEREKQELFAHARIEVIRSILEVLDNLERAVATGQSESGNLEAFLSGVELIQKQLYTSLVNFGLTPVPAVGEAFDPMVHEAVATEVTTEYEHNTVVQELKRGYQLGDRLLRPAMVRVAIRS